MPEKRPAIVKDEYLTYLVELRDSGVTNMFGAGAYLQGTFGLSSSDARTVLTYWTCHDFESLGRVQGQIFNPNIEDTVDANMLVKGPLNMEMWLEDSRNAVKLHDASPECIDLAWNGTTVVGSDRDDDWKTLEQILED